MNFVNGEIETQVKNSGVASGDPNDYVLDDRNINAPLPGQAIAGANARSSTDPRQPGVSDIGQEDTALIGGTTNDIVAYPANFISGSHLRGGSGTPERTTVIETQANPFTGDNEDVRSYVKTRTSRKGETVYREVI